jgi:outer membrane biosynthesis protein TonB
VPPRCEGHGSQEICKQTGKLANEYCPEKETQAYGVVVPKERLNLWKPLGQAAQNKQKIEEVCDVHKKPEEPAPEPEKPKEEKKEEKKDDKKEEEKKEEKKDENGNGSSGGSGSNGGENTGGNNGGNSGGNTGGGETPSNPSKPTT